MQAEGLPVHADNMSSVWTLSYEEPSRYNWMYQFYLRDQGLALSWVGTGRFIFSLNFTGEDFEEVLQRCVRAGQLMRADGWWLAESGLSNRTIRRQVLREVVQALVHR